MTGAGEPAAPLGTVALTYAELAERLGIEVASAKMRARRGRWRREPGNDGRTRVHVPVEVLEVVPEVLQKAPPPPAVAVPVLLPTAAAPDTREAQLRADHAAEVARLAEAHKAALDVLREAHAAEILRMEAARQRDREAHAAEVERTRAGHAAEMVRLAEAHRQAMGARRHAAGMERVRTGIEGARRWLAGIAPRRGR